MATHFVEWDRLFNTNEVARPVYTIRLRITNKVKDQVLSMTEAITIHLNYHLLMLPQTTRTIPRFSLVIREKCHGVTNDAAKPTRYLSIHVIYDEVECTIPTQTYRCCYYLFLSIKYP